MGGSFNSGFRQNRYDSVPDLSTQASSRPEYFEANSDHDIRLNSSLSLPGIFGLGGDKSFLAGIKKGMDRWSLRNLDASYTVSHKYNRERYRYESLGRKGLDREKGLGRGEFYAYQFGMVYESLADFFYNLVDGEPDPGFMDYLSVPDTIAGENEFSHEVNRSLDVGTGFTVPVLDLSLSFNGKYSKLYTLHRALLASDTSVTFPDYTVTGTFNDFASRIALLRRYFRSVTSTTTFNYRVEDRRARFSSSPDRRTTSFKLDPLVRVAATTNKDLRTEASVRLGRDLEDQYYKVAGGTEDVRYYGGWKPLTWYARPDSMNNPKEGFNVGGDISVSKDIETQKGIQFWRYYIKLQNNLRLKISSGVNYLFSETRYKDQDPVRNQDQLTGTVKPEVSYNFTNNVDAMFFMQYKYDKLWHTGNNESTHEVQLHGEFTMRF